MTPSRYSKILASYFNALPLWKRKYYEKEVSDLETEICRGSDYNDNPNVRKVSELPYQLVMSNNLSLVEKTLSDLWFIEAKVRTGKIFELLKDYLFTFNYIQNNFYRKENNGLNEHQIITKTSNSIEPFYSFVRSRSHLLNALPLMTIQEAYNHTSSDLVRNQAYEILRNLNPLSFIWLQRINLPTASGNPCKQTLKPLNHPGIIKSMSISKDCTYLLCVYSYGDIEVWDLRYGKYLKTLEVSGCNCILTVPDGTRFITASNDAIIRVWDFSTWTCKLKISGNADAIAVTQDSQRLISISTSHNILQAWDINSGSCLTTIHGSFGKPIVVSPDGQLVFTVDLANVCLWNLSTGDLISEIGTNGKEICSLAVTPDGKSIIVGGGSLQIKVFDIQSGNKLLQLDDNLYTSPIAVTPDGKKLISAGFGGLVRVWDLESGNCIKNLTGHTEWTTGIHVLPDGNSFISWSRDNTIKIWDLNLIANEDGIEGHITKVEAIKVLSDGQHVVTSSDFGTIKIWNINTGKCAITRKGLKFTVRKIIDVPSGRHFITLGNENFVDKNIGYNSEVKLWETHTGNCIWTIPGYKDFTIERVILTSDGQKVLLIATNVDGPIPVGRIKKPSTIIGIVDIKKPSIAENLFFQLQHNLISIKQTPDGKTLIILEKFGKIHLVDINKKALIRLLDTGEKRWDEKKTEIHITFDKKIVVEQPDYYKRLWIYDLNTNKTLEKPDWGDIEKFKVIPFSNLVATYNNQGFLRIWELVSGTCIREERYKSSDICYLNFLRIVQNQSIIIKDDNQYLEVRDLHKNAKYATYSFEGRYCNFDSNLNRTLIACGMEDGQVHIIKVANTEPHIAAGSLYHLYRSKIGKILKKIIGKSTHAFICPFCHSWTEVTKSSMGEKTTCPKCNNMIEFYQYKFYSGWRYIVKSGNVINM